MGYACYTKYKALEKARMNKNEKINIAIVAGGDSSEYVISVKSAEQIKSQINQNKFNTYTILIKQNSWKVLEGDLKDIEIDKNDFSIPLKKGKIEFDVVVVAIHGTPGEDGKIQGYFDLLRIPYTSCDRLTSSLTFNKYFCNKYLESFDILSAKSILLRKGHLIPEEEIIEKLKLPLFVKPNNGGSSFGISKVSEAKFLKLAIDKAFDEDNEIIVEEFIAGTEVTCGVFKSENNEIVLPLTEIVSKNEFFDFEAKYTDGMADEITPARISEKDTKICQKLASEIYDLTNCKGIVRIDFILKQDKFYLLEINTIPGMTKNSIVPQQLEAFGISLSELLELVIQDAIENTNFS